MYLAPRRDVTRSIS